MLTGQYSRVAGRRASGDMYFIVFIALDSGMAMHDCLVGPRLSVRWPHASFAAVLRSAAAAPTLRCLNVGPTMNRRPAIPCCCTKRRCCLKRRLDQHHLRLAALPCWLKQVIPLGRIKLYQATTTCNSGTVRHCQGGPNGRFAAKYGRTGGGVSDSLVGRGVNS
jgi:hypothetical protein